jgi:16S rRNA A1518/A1519 N6-dimethyltransferase RsmA/KsgA/DIM1 with predicted DNA glycosylase/AP lyase activity
MDNMLLPLPKSSLHLMCNDFKNIMQIIEEDITKFNVRSHFLPFLEEKSHHTRKYAKVVSNLPFNVSTEVVKLLLPMGDVFSVMVLLLQV